jgi:hypothetical protein
VIPKKSTEADPADIVSPIDPTLDAEFRRLTSNPAKTFEEWLEMGERACVRLSQDEEYRRKMARFLS